MLKNLLFLFFLYLPFQIALNPMEGIDLASIRVIITIIFLLWILQGLKNKKIIIPFNLVTALIFSFLFLDIFSLFFATNIEWGIRKLLFIFSIFPLYFVIASLSSQRKGFLFTILKFLVWGAGISALIGFFQFISQFFFGITKTYSLWTKIIVPFLGKSFSEAVLNNSSWLVNIAGHTFLRATAFFPDPHMFSFYLGITAPLALSLHLFKHSTSNYFGFLFLIIVLVDFLTFSRGGYLGLLFGLSFFAFFYLKQKNYSFFQQSIKQSFAHKNIINKTFLSSGLISILIFLFFIIPNPATQRLFSSFNLSEGSNIGRLEMWRQSLNIIKKNPVLGVGLGNYASTIKPSAIYREPIYSHNTYLDIAVETGILNAFIWIAILILSINNFIRRFIKTKNLIYLGLASGLVVFTIHSIFDTAIFSVHILPLIMLIIAV
ncbi:MAG TPA: O-antigen ligase family protein [Candidatus Moranbacteria bacterium]|nr:O-antigen ligase family protein [Candidatus Moranbacteria bacterium]